MYRIYILVALCLFRCDQTTYYHIIKILFVLVAKTYASPEEEKTRFQKFSKNFVTVLQHNSEQTLGMHSFSLGINEYSDLVSDRTDAMSLLGLGSIL